jgi:putative PIN family toxin of toxin-antitoxin system
MIRAVIDTNVLVSALLSPNGNEALLLLAIRRGLIAPCITREIVDEYIDVLSRPKFSFPATEVEELIALLRNGGQLVQPGEPTVFSPDPKDTMFLQCAIASLADFLVTGNKRHFPASPYGSTYVVNARELLSQITLDITHFS